MRSCYDEGKRTAETLAMDYHRGAGVEVHIMGYLIVLMNFSAFPCGYRISAPIFTIIHSMDVCSYINDVQK